VADNATNANSASDTVKIDTVDPTISASHSANAAGWNNASPVDVTIGVSDATSGIAGAPSCTVDSNPATVTGSGPYHLAVSGEGTHAISCSVSDNAGRSNSASDTVKIDLTKPSVSVSQASASDAFGVAQDDPTATTPIRFTAVFSEPINGFGNASVTIAGSASAGATANVYNPSGDRKTWKICVTPTVAGTVTVTIGASKVTDDADNSNTSSTSSDNSVTYQPVTGNAAPTVVVDSPGFGSVYAKGSATINPMTLKAHFSDVDNGPWTWNVNWDDNGSVSTGSVSGSSAADVPFQATHAFVNPGVYTINVRVTDSKGSSGTASLWIVVYDPNGGFVTGGGFINVNPGSYASDPTLSGRANFGFNSQYKKNANVPTGETEFNFQVGNFNFHSDAYNWLVVSGFKAQYKGTGSVNGASGYDFTLTAYDGDITGGGGADKFRIRITKTNGGDVVFDNKNGAPIDMDTADPQVIAGGSIVIHKA
jgi:hypothetical protein